MNFYQVGWFTKKCLQAGCCTHLKLMMNGCAVLSNTLFSAIVCSTCTSYDCPPFFLFSQPRCGSRSPPSAKSSSRITSENRQIGVVLWKSIVTRCQTYKNTLNWNGANWVFFAISDDWHTTENAIGERGEPDFSSLCREQPFQMFRAQEPEHVSWLFFRYEVGMNKW